MDTPRARWDAVSVRAWLGAARVPTRLGRDLIEATVSACFAADLSEVSLLNWLFLVRSAGGVEALMTVTGGYQDSQFEGGVQQVPDAMAAELGEAVVRSCPVDAVTQHDDRVIVEGTRATVTARRVVLALPRALAAGIRFDPVLPADHALLIHQVPAGTEMKMVAVYDEPFWRADGVCGATVATDDAIEVTLDTTQPGHREGVIAGYSAGPRAHALAQLPERERRAAFLAMLATRLGPKAAAPLEVLERTGRRSDGRGAAPWATSRRACSPSTAAGCASRSAGCTGPAPRRRRPPTELWTAQCARASVCARRS